MDLPMIAAESTDPPVAAVSRHKFAFNDGDDTARAVTETRATAPHAVHSDDS